MIRFDSKADKMRCHCGKLDTDCDPKSFHAKDIERIIVCDDGTITIELTSGNGFEQTSREISLKGKIV